MSGQAVALSYTPAADTTPNAFTFTDQTGVALSTVITSAAITISGLSTGTSITLNASGGTIDKNGDANFLGSQLVQNGDTVRARVTSSGSNSTAADCTVVASPSGVQDTFSATTLSSGTFTPLRDINFNGLADAASVSSSGTANKRFDFWGTYSNGFGSRATTAVARSGNSSSCAMSVQSGNDGGTGGGTGPNGSFGGGISFDSTLQTAQGEDLFIGMWLRFPSTFNFTANTGYLKFLRILQVNGSGAENGGKLEHHIKGNSAGFNLASEITPNSQTITLKDCDRKIVKDDAWHQICWQTRAHATTASCIRRIWVDGQLSYERTGGVLNKWRSGGAWQTENFSGTGTAEPTLAVSTGKLSGIMLFTYWNGNSPQDQTCHLQRIVFHKNAAELNGTDEFGNKFIDMSAF